MTNQINKTDILNAMLRGEFIPFDEADYDMFAGTLGEGWSGEINDRLVVLDIYMDAMVVNVMDAEGGAPEVHHFS